MLRFHLHMSKLIWGTGCGPHLDLAQGPVAGFLLNPLL